MDFDNIEIQIRMTAQCGVHTRIIDSRIDINCAGMPISVVVPCHIKLFLSYL